ncbi:hypothetical protein FOZ60_010423 [Perkinsus olseni]|uniref:UBA domain-containing protein n=1 Tax=Perkinsus olseni TaxID=32597 RepID=A0A7J6NF57_PEROL|nr:hypothetical protein FOZ60_010423 [Perkinsus olseni]
MSRPFTDDDIKAVRDLCPIGSDSDVELALWRANGDRNVAVNMLLSQQPRPAGNAPEYPRSPQVAAPTVAFAVSFLMWTTPPRTIAQPPGLLFGRQTRLILCSFMYFRAHYR